MSSLFRSCDKPVERQRRDLLGRIFGNSEPLETVKHFVFDTLLLFYA